MKICHAAALALVGWYLMTPPINKHRGAFDVDPQAPLFQWIVNTPFDAASKCAEINSGIITKYQREMGKNPAGSLKWAVAKSLALSQCISTDDPRLKEK
jgi:hypothetical protein